MPNQTQVAAPEWGQKLLGQPLVDVLHDVAELAADRIPGVDDASVALVEEDLTRTVAFTGGLAAALDERQYCPGFGPGLDGTRPGAVIRLDDTAASDVYPAFAATARRQGVRSVLVLGLPTPPWAAGSLSLYRTSGAEPLDADAEKTARLFAARASATIANAALLAGRERHSAHLEKALESRATIEQAKGIVMATMSCSADQAFRILAQRSMNANRKLRDLAVEVVDAASRPREPMVRA
jgi:GAF domain-containing protein